MTAIEEEAEWLAALSAEDKVILLASLIHELTMSGRNSYRPQTEDLEKPSQLRHINEIQHRVAACLCQHCHPVEGDVDRRKMLFMSGLRHKWRVSDLRYVAPFFVGFLEIPLAKMASCMAARRFSLN